MDSGASCPACGTALAGPGGERCAGCTATLRGGGAEVSLVARTQGVEARPIKLALTPGFRERYEIGRMLGAGAMGVVYRAQQRSTGRDVALKFVLTRDAEVVARVVRESRALGRVSHPNVLRIFESDEVGGLPYLVTELLAGGTLAERAVEPLPLQAATGTMLEVLAGLAACHAAGVVHRDLKPSNVMFDGEGRARVVDLGLAHLSGAEELTRTGAVLGTPRYMSPEQVLGQPTSPATDVYAAGCMLFELIAGRPAFGETSVGAVLGAHVKTVPERLDARLPGTPKAVADVVAAALAKRPEERPRDAEELARRLVDAVPDTTVVRTLALSSDALAGLAVQRDAANPTPRIRPGSSASGRTVIRKPPGPVQAGPIAGASGTRGRGAIAAAALALLIAGVAAASLRRAQHPEPPPPSASASGGPSAASPAPARAGPLPNPEKHWLPAGALGRVGSPWGRRVRYHAVAVAASGRWMVTEEVAELRLWEVRTKRLVTARAIEQRWPLLAIDEARGVVIGAGDSKVAVWNLETLEPKALTDLELGQNLCAISPRGRYLLGRVRVRERDRRLFLTDTTTGRGMEVGQSDGPLGGAVSENGRVVMFTGAGFETVPRAPGERRVVLGSRQPAALVISEDGRRAAALLPDRVVVVVDTATGAEVARVAPAAIGALAISADGEWLTYSVPDRGQETGLAGELLTQSRLALHDVRSGRIGLSPTSADAALFASDRVVSLLAARIVVHSPGSLAIPADQLDTAVRVASPQGFVVVGGAKLEVVDGDRMERVRALPAPPGAQPRLDSSGRWILLDEPGKRTLVDPETLRPLGTQPSLSTTTPPLVLPDGRAWVVTDPAGTALVRDAVRLPLELRSSVPRLVSRTGRLLAADAPTGLTIVDLVTGAPKVTLTRSEILARLNQSQHAEIAFAADDGAVLLGEPAGSVHAFSVNDGRVLLRYPARNIGRVTSIDASPDGRLVAAGWDDGRCGVFLARTGRLLAEYPSDGLSPKVAIDAARARLFVTHYSGALSGALPDASGHVTVWPIPER